MKAFNELSLTVKLSIHFTLLLLTPLFLVIFISYFSFAKNIETNTKQTIDEFSTLTVEAMDQTYRQLSELSMDIVADHILWEKLGENGGRPYEKEFDQWKRKRDIEQILTTKSSKLDGITNIGIMLLDGTLYSSNLRIGRTVFEESNKTLFDSAWYRDFVSHDPSKSLYRMDNGNVIFINRINRMDQFNKPLGLLVFEMDAKIFENMFKGTFRSEDMLKYIVNERNEMIYGSGVLPANDPLLQITQAEQSTEIKIGSENYWLQRKKSSLTGWALIEMIPQNVMIRNANQLRNTSIFLTIICYILSLLLTLLLSRNVVNPLRKIMTKMKDVDKWMEQELLEVSGPSEVRDIAYRFNLMRHEIGHLIENIREEQKRAKEADMAALQAQINPHFLYNTLHLIMFLARKRKNDEIQTLTGSLISFLQNSLKNGNFIVPLTTELRMIEHYFLLHQFRMEGNIQLFITVEQGLLRIKIPRFILQPIVENAIFHGLYPKQDTGTIRITVAEESGDMVGIKIIDDGVGIHQKAQRTQQTRVGLINVRERLKHLFPDAEASVSLHSRPGFGTTVLISIPKII